MPDEARRLSAGGAAILTNHSIGTRTAVPSRRSDLQIRLTALNKIAAVPEQFALVDALHRECLVKRFPFRIVYRIESASVLIVAIAHAKRRPGYGTCRD